MITMYRFYTASTRKKLVFFQTAQVVQRDVSTYEKNGWRFDQVQAEEAFQDQTRKEMAKALKRADAGALQTVVLVKANTLTYPEPFKPQSLEDGDHLGDYVGASNA